MIVESSLRDLAHLNDRMWARVQPLEEQLRELEVQYQVMSGRPAVDAAARGWVALLEPHIRAAIQKLNTAYDEWQRNITYFMPSPSTASAGSWADKIPWPSSVPADVRTYLTETLQRKERSATKRVTVKPVKLPIGGFGVSVEFSH